MATFNAHDDEGQSLYNMYGFKHNEANIQGVFKFNPACKNMNISENCKNIISLSDPFFFSL